LFIVASLLLSDPLAAGSADETQSAQADFASQHGVSNPVAARTDTGATAGEAESAQADFVP
jgi:hypothetical protein